MAARDALNRDITPQVLLKAYSCGIFPMAESADDPQLYWIEPVSRGILPLNCIALPKRLIRTIKKKPFEVVFDTNFDKTIDGCAASRPGRRTTWINDQIRVLYRELYILGHCHTVEVWKDGKMVGGLYGVALGGAFFGESMFSTETDASKIALVYLCARLIHGGFTLLDTQFVTDHLRQFGTIEVDRAAFHQELETALARQGQYKRLGSEAPPSQIIEIIEAERGRSTGAIRMGFLARRPATSDDRRFFGRWDRRLLPWLDFGSGWCRSGISGRLAAISQPNIENRMFHSVEARALGKHPAGKQLFYLAIELRFIDLDKAGCLRRFGRRSGIADARCDGQRTELHRLAEGNFQL